MTPASGCGASASSSAARSSPPSARRRRLEAARSTLRQALGDDSAIELDRRRASRATPDRARRRGRQSGTADAGTPARRPIDERAVLRFATVTPSGDERGRGRARPSRAAVRSSSSAIARLSPRSTAADDVVETLPTSGADRLRGSAGDGDGRSCRARRPPRSPRAARRGRRGSRRRESSATTATASRVSAASRTSFTQPTAPLRLGARSRFVLWPVFALDSAIATPRLSRAVSAGKLPIRVFRDARDRDRTVRVDGREGRRSTRSRRCRSRRNSRRRV